MGEIFIYLLNMSITAGWLILAVLCVRFLFRKIPKWITCLLWGVVAIRLIFPFSVESEFSLQPSAEPVKFSTMVEGEVVSYVPSVDSNLGIIENVVNPMLAETFAYQEAESVSPLQAFAGIAGIVWLCGMFVLFIFAAVSMIKLRLCVREAVLYKENIYVCDAVKSPFILGIIKPGIYLSSALNKDEMDYIIAHEKAHLRRKDHLWKPFGYLLLCVYWFNPLCWVAYIMLCKDIELACDEKVIKNMSFGDKKEYSRVLLSCASQRRLVLVCPLAFGEVGVKERVKSVLNYKKPAFWITVIAIIVCVIVAICFLTNPLEEKPESDNNTNEDDIVELVDNDVSEEVEEETVLDVKEPAMDMEDVQRELDRVISSVGLENAYPWNNTVDFKSDADALIKMASDETGRFEIYGIMSAKYGTYGLLLNDWIDGEQNWNYAYVPWFYTGAPSEQPTLEPDGTGKYIFSYICQYEDGVLQWQECILDCGYDTGHMELISQEGTSEEIETPVAGATMVDASKIAGIVITNGDTGERKTLTGEDIYSEEYYYYNDLLKLYRQLDFTAPTVENDRIGYQYSMKLQDAEGNKLQLIIPYVDGVVIDGFLYKYDDAEASVRLMEYLEYALASE